MKLRYVSRRLRRVSREIPSLWRDFIWPHLDNNEVRCVKTVLKSCGQHVKRLSLPDHVISSKLTSLLRPCVNLVELSIPTSKLSPDQLITVMKSAEKLQGLDIQWTSQIYPLLEVCGRPKVLTVRIGVRQLYYCTLSSGLDSWMDKWVMNGFQPQTLKITAQDIPRNSPLKDLVEHWYLLNPHSPAGCTGYLQAFSSLKVPMDLYSALPDFQLKFVQSCTLPFVKPSKCGLLGLEGDDILLNDY